MMEESRGIDDVLTLKLAIEPTEATRQSLNELSGLADEILETIVKASQAFDTTQEQRQMLRQTLMSVDADESYQRVQEELSASRETMRETLESVATSRVDTVPDNRINPDLQATPISRDDAISRAQSYESLTARGIPVDYEQIGLISDNGGVDSVLSNALDREDGGLSDQLSIIASRMGQSISDSISGAINPVTPRFADTLENLPDSAMDRLIEAVQATADSTKKLADKAEQDELAEKGVGAPARPQRPEPSKPDRAPRPDKPPKPEPSDEERRYTAGQQIEELLGVDRRRSAVSGLQSRANLVSGWGESLTRISETLATPQEVVLDENGNPLSEAAQTAGLLSAGARVAGATGLGEIGGRVSQIGKGIAGAASRFAVPLAIGAGAYTALDKGTEAFYQTSQLGYAQGETGFGAFTTGFMDNLSDRWSGFNPFTPEDTQTLRRYRETALNNTLGIRPDSEGLDSLIDAQTQFGRRGLRPEQALQLFGQEILDDSSFDVEEALDMLAEGAREAGVSLQNFVTTAIGVADQLEDRFDITDTEFAAEVSAMMNTGLFDAETGALGKLDDRQKTSLISSLMDYNDPRSMRFLSLLRADETTMGRMESDGIDTMDRDAMLEWAWSGNLDTEELENLIVGVGRQGMPEGLNQERQRAWYQSRLGVSVPSGRLDLMPDYEPGDESNGESWSGVISRSETVSPGGGARSGTRPQGTGGEVNLNIRLSEGLVADVSTTQELNRTVAGDTDYEDRSQSGRTGASLSFTNNYNTITGG